MERFDDDLVSVVIPAYNAQATLWATLESVCRQSYRSLEVIIVDDGSTDHTVSLGRAAAAQDSRIRIISSENCGVGRARNLGIAASRGAFVAPVDADDLWHPEKIARQMAVMRAGGTGMGFAYTFYRRIDQTGEVLYSSSVPPYSGATYLRLLLVNFVGNGSSLLIRRAALDEIGGYEPGLHRQGAQGCEDWLVQLLIARHWAVGVVPEYLTGYRQTRNAMSENRERILRSRLLMLDYVRRRFPETPAEVLAVAEAAARFRLAVLHGRSRGRVQAAIQLEKAIRLSPRTVLALASDHVRQRLPGRFRWPSPSPPGEIGATSAGFFGIDPAAGWTPPPRHALSHWIDALAPLEDEFFLSRAHYISASSEEAGRAPA